MENQDPNLGPNDPHDPVDRALAALEIRTANAPGLPRELAEQTLARLAAAQRPNPKPQINWRSIIMKPTFQLSAAAVMAIVLGGLFWVFNPDRSGVAFAEALAKVADVKSVSYRIEMHGR